MFDDSTGNYCCKQGVTLDTREAHGIRSHDIPDKVADDQLYEYQNSHCLKMSEYYMISE